MESSVTTGLGRNDLSYEMEMKLTEWDQVLFLDIRYATDRTHTNATIVSTEVFNKNDDDLF